MVEDLFKKFERVGERALKTRQSLVDRMLRELVTHTYIEEQVFYPFVRSLSKKLNDETLEALEEHHVAKATLAELQTMESSEERFTPKVTVLIESVRHHVKEEEGSFSRRRAGICPPRSCRVRSGARSRKSEGTVSCVAHGGGHTQWRDELAANARETSPTD